MMSKIFLIKLLALNLILSSCKKSSEASQKESSTPHISMLIPNIGSYEDRIVIKGSNFGARKDDVEVKFNDQIVEIQEFSSTQLILIAPNLNLLGQIAVKVKIGGQESNVTRFTYKQKAEVIKITSTGHWIPRYTEEIQITGYGPFIRLKDGSIFAVREGGVKSSISKDEGKTWVDSPILSAQDYSLLSPVFIQTSTGAIILGFTNGKEKANWNWNNQTHDSPGAKLPTYTIRSTDGGKTWTDLQKLHEDWTGMNRDIKETANGNIVFATMMLKHNPGRHTVLTYTTKDDGKSWIRSNILDEGGSGDHSGLMESTLEQLKDGRLWMLLRTNWGYFYETFSSDEGLTWSKPVATSIDASSSPGALKRLKSGRLVLVYNRNYPEGKTTYPLLGGDNNLSEVPASWQREELSMIISNDEGKTWTAPVVIAKNYLHASYTLANAWDTKKWLSYPFVFEAHPGELWVTTGHGGLKIKFNERDYIN